MMNTRHERHRTERGNELIEFALVLPLLVLLLAGTIEFGRAFYTYNILTKSVRNAARYISASEIGYDAVIDPVYVLKTKNLAVFGNVDGTGTKVIPDLVAGHIAVNVPSGAPAGRFYVEVSASYPYSPLFGFVLPSVTFRPSVTMEFVGTVTYYLK